MKFTNSITVVASVFFGLLLGMTALTAAAYFGGFIDFDETGQAKSDVQSQTPGMDILNEYSCRKGETKQILLGGIEDNYSPEGDETLSETAYQKSYAAYVGSGPRNRNYDQGGQDLMLLQYFLIPKNTAHGIYVVRMKSISSIQNDSIGIGDHPDDYFDRVDNFYSGFIHELRNNSSWIIDDDLYSISLDGILINSSSDSEPVKTILDFIQSSRDPTREIGIKVSDDTMVDFMGVSLCLGPEEDLGTVYKFVDPFSVKYPKNEPLKDWPAQTVYASYAEIDDLVCNPYTGCENCSRALPLACFKNSRLAVPLIDKRFVPYWSGGEIKLTTPVPGDQFKTADDAHEYCVQMMGEKWRVLSSNDGRWIGSILAKHTKNPGPENFWIDIKGQPHGNCWAQRSEAGGGNE